MKSKKLLNKILMMEDCLPHENTNKYKSRTNYK